MYIRDIIMKKRNKHALNDEEICFAIQGYFKKEISDAQMSALMTAMHISGLSENELLYLIESMADTGEKLEFYKISNRITDIHVLGGVSDKVILALMSIIHSLGYPVAKVIGRELGMEDRLLSLSGYNIEDNVDSFKEHIQNDEMCILKSINNLAPVEERLYKLRHEIACDNDMNLIATSIMSQKIALGFYNIFFEITYGSNAFVKTFSDAKLLAKYLISIGKKEMRNVACAITPLNEPIGNSFGNLIELKEIYDYLSGKTDNELDEVVINFGSNILAISGYCKDINKNKMQIKDSIKNGNALKSFERLITSRGGKIELLKKDIEVKNKIPIMSNSSGYVSEIDVNQLRQLAKYLNAIRGSVFGSLDYGAGVIFNKKIGDLVHKGDIIAYVYTNDETKISQAVSMAKEIFKLSDKKNKKLSRVEYNINNI